MITITTPLLSETVLSLQAGTQVLLSGTVYTGRDAAHKRFMEAMERSQELPVDLHNQVIYYTGPAPAPKGKVIGSAGPTTSSRMDAFTPALLAKTGLRGMIGKGNRSKEVIEAMKRLGVVYFAATGGAGALLSKCITASEVVCYEDLGTEAVHKLEFKDFPLIVAIDSMGNNLYERIS
ncbi:MAG: Fe-S-containing hydro-lyase [Fibrobacter sp.]|nr:Fe-S-containing hydro-lyase [Fibrobacter sp.]